MSTLLAPAPADDLFEAFFDLSLMGGIVFAPLFNAAGQLIDFTYVRLNQAAQKLLAMPAHPTESFLARFPHALPTGIFNFYREVYESGAARRSEFNYQYDGLDNYFHLAASRVGQRLLVSFTDTSDQPRTAVEQALRQSQTREQQARAEAEHQRGELHRIFEQAPVAIAVYRGPNYIIELANPTLCRLWGRRAEDIVGLGLFEALPEVAGMGYEELLDGVMATGVPYVAHAMEAVHERDGHRDTAYWDFVYEPMYASDGSIYGAMVVATEVTAQVQARRQLEQLNQELENRVQERTRALAEQQGLLSSILGQVPAAIATLSGPEHRYTFFNNHYQTLTANRPVLGQTVSMQVPELAAQGMVKLLDQVYATGQPYSGSAVPVELHSTETGLPLQYYFDFVYQPLFDGQQQVQSILAFIVDVTEKVLARQQADAMQASLLAAAQQQVRQREELNQVFEQAPVGICLLRGPDFVVELINETAADMWGRGTVPASLLGSPWHAIVPDLPGSDLLAAGQRMLQTGEPYYQHEVGYQLNRAAQGKPDAGYFNIAYQPWRDEQSQIVGIIAVGIEVTEQVRARQQVERLNEELEARVQQRTRELQAAQATTERERALLQAIITQAPVAIGLYQGQELRVAAANELMAGLWGYTPTQVLGLPLMVAVPELQGQGFDDLLHQVLDTREPFKGVETPATMLRNGQLQTTYYNFVYQPLYAPEGQVIGVINVAVEVTEQVEARRKVQHLNEESATINEELRATNEEYQRANSALSEAQQQLRQLNEELEARVQQRTQEAEDAHAEAERQRRQWERVFMRAPAAICIFNGPEWVFEFVNPGYQAMFHGRALLGRRLLSAMPELAGQPLLDILHHVYDTGETFEGKEVLVPLARTEGGVPEDIYFDITYSARYNDQGQIDGFITYAYDVTEQVYARREREARQGELQRIFEQAPVAIAIFRGPRYIIELANPAICAIWGRTQQQALGTPVFDLLPESAGQGFEELLDGVMASGETYVAHEMPTFIDRHGRRDLVYWDFVYQPLREPGNDQITAVLVVAIEVTEQVLARQQVQHLNEEMQSANTELQAANRQLTRTNTDLDTFVYTASHDLKAPITNIEGLLAALRDYLPPHADPDQMVPRLLSMMETSVARFQQTIGHLTDVSRLHYATTEPAEAVQLAYLAEDVRLDLVPLLTSTRGQLQVEVTSCPTVYFSPKNLRSMLYNLLSNALKYHAPDRAPVVQLRASCPPGQLVLEVQDNGLGMSAQQQAKLFALFQRLHTHVEGSGVGLYMLKRIVENGGGTIRVRSELGVGSTFTITLPHVPPTQP